MSHDTIRISDTQLRSGGRQIKLLAMIGQAFLVFSIFAVPWILWMIAEPTRTYAGFSHFMWTLVTPPLGAGHLHDLARVLSTLLLFEFLRRWGKQLAGPAPTGPAMLATMAKLKWAVLLLAAISAFSFSHEPTGYQPEKLSDLKTTPFDLLYRMTWDFSIYPLFMGAIVFVCLHSGERLASEAERLRAENAEFI